MGSPQIGPDDFNQLLGGRAPAPACPAERMVPDVSLHHFGHEAIHGAAAGRDQPQHVTTLVLLRQCAFECFDLPANPVHAVEEFCLIADRVSHGARAGRGFLI